MSPAVGDTGTSHYYLVKTVGPAGLKSADSNYAGEFDRVMIHDAPSR
jgi:hypothetical protein